MGDVLGLVDKSNMMLLLGCYCNQPKLILDKSCETIADDYGEPFHKMIWATMYNLAKKGSVIEINPIDIENELLNNQRALDLWEQQDGYSYIERIKVNAKGKEGNAVHYRNNMRKYSILRDATTNLKLDISFVYDETDEVTLARFNRMTCEELLDEIKVKFIDFNGKWTTSRKSSNSSHRLGDSTQEVVEEYKTQETVYGYPFQSAYLNTILRGMRKQNFFLRSAPSGQGKTRNSLADAVNVSCDRMYDWKTKQWMGLGEKEPTLFISTEISAKALERMAIAHISGIHQDRFNNWDALSNEEQEIIYDSIDVIKDSLMYIEYMPEFTIDSIKEMIEKHIIINHVTKVFFDYINDSPQIYAEFYEKSKTRLRTDQILFMFSNSLKQIADDYNIFLSSSTQVNDNYKQEEGKDSSALKGSKAIAEKVDIGMLALPVTKKMRELIDPIMKKEGEFGKKEPTMSYHIYKNRDGKYNNVIVFTRFDLGTMREEDCFVTDNNYTLIEMDKTELLYTMEVNDAEEIQVDEDYGKEEIINMTQSLNS